jgi:catechol 2,3-dioxygenase-like lactoylglutathione lyase family enzyme
MTEAKYSPGWEITHIGLAVHDPDEAAAFYGDIVGLTQADARHSFSNGTQGLTLFRHDPDFGLRHRSPHNPFMVKSAVLAVPDLGAVAARLEKAGVAAPTLEAPFPGLGAVLFCHDPAVNLIGFTERQPLKNMTDEAGWILHHVNLQAHDVRASVRFFVETAGMVEGHWRAPAARGDFSIDPHELAVLDLGAENRGLHVIRPDAGFGKRNGFAHNPSIGGHPAFRVPDIQAVMRRLDAAGVVYSDAGTYAMDRYHQVYVYDPSFNLIEINQRL